MDQEDLISQRGLRKFIPNRAVNPIFNLGALREERADVSLVLLVRWCVAPLRELWQGLGAQPPAGSRNEQYRKIAGCLNEAKLFLQKTPPLSSAAPL